MACNCNKGKANRQAQTGQAQPANQVTQIDSTTQKPVVSSPPDSSSNGSTPTQTFALQIGSKRVGRYGSRLEADAANVRRGYTGKVVEVR